ncbi:MAG: hypothetical protein RLZ12_365, partial [Bacillota bacterium]
IEDPGYLADLIVSHLTLQLSQKQSLLETINVRSRLEKLITFLHQEMEILDLEKKIVARVKGQMDKAQKEYYLREQLKAIQQELGEKDSNTLDCERFRASLLKLKAGAKIKEKILTEIERLEKLPASSAESGVIRSYVECLLEIPWVRKTTNSFSLKQAEQTLNRGHTGLEKPKERILEHFAVQSRGRGKVATPILCLVGPPGVGKTSIARSMATAVNRKFVRISLGGVRDEAEIRGHRRTYIGAFPGRVVQAIRQAGVSNPIILLDEIDKMAVDFRGDPGAALLEVLDPEQNHRFLDHYLDIPFDLSKVMFLATANSLHNIAGALLDRLEIIQLSGYTELEKEAIAYKHLLPRQMKDHGLEKKELQIYTSTIKKIIHDYTCEAGVRELERCLATICRKAVKKTVSGYQRKIVVTPRNINLFLGKAKNKSEQTDMSDQVGVSMGLAWTEYGGDILPIEVSVCAGKGSLTLTGQLGDIMQESAKAAFSYIRSRADELGILPTFNEEQDVHVHFPEGAIPKDGPSAGIAIAIALISALTRRPVSGKVAMTGEITLRGRVLASGGLKEKVLSAHRTGIKKVLYPKLNEPDLVDVPLDVRNELDLRPVAHMDEVLKMALVEQKSSVCM